MVTQNKTISRFSLICLCLLLATCRSPEASIIEETRLPTIRFIVNPWLASELNVEVARYILEEEMNYSTEVVVLDGEEQWPALAAGEAHVSLEVWPSARKEIAQQYLELEQTVIAGNELGVIGKVGWYIPTYMLREHPELATWEGFLEPDNAALFATERTELQGQFFGGDRNWGHYDEEIIRNLNLDFQVVYLPDDTADTEAATIAALDTAYQAGNPFLFYFWTPHWAYILYDLSEIELPPYTEECYRQAAIGSVACDYPSDILYKIYWADFPTYAPEAYQFLQNLRYSNRDQIAMLAMVQLDNMTAHEAAMTWIAEHESLWRSWIPE